MKALKHATHLLELLDHTPKPATAKQPQQYYIFTRSRNIALRRRNILLTSPLYNFISNLLTVYEREALLPKAPPNKFSPSYSWRMIDCKSACQPPRKPFLPIQVTLVQAALGCNIVSRLETISSFNAKAHLKYCSVDRTRERCRLASACRASSLLLYFRGVSLRSPALNSQTGGAAQ